MEFLRQFVNRGCPVVSAHFHTEINGAIWVGLLDYRRLLNAENLHQALQTAGLGVASVIVDHGLLTIDDTFCADQSCSKACPRQTIGCHLIVAFEWHRSADLHAWPFASK